MFKQAKFLWHRCGTHQAKFLVLYYTFVTIFPPRSSAQNSFSRFDRNLWRWAIFFYTGFYGYFCFCFLAQLLVDFYAYFFLAQFLHGHLQLLFLPWKFFKSMCQTPDFSQIFLGTETELKWHYFCSRFIFDFWQKPNL